MAWVTRFEPLVIAGHGDTMLGLLFLAACIVVCAIAICKTFRNS